MGTVHIKDGLTRDMLTFVMELKFERKGRLHEFAGEFDVEYIENEKPWFIPGGAVFPSATQNEISGIDADILIKNGCKLVCEGANMPCTFEASKLIRDSGIAYGIGKAANAGGVTVSGLEMAQGHV